MRVEQPSIAFDSFNSLYTIKFPNWAAEIIGFKSCGVDRRRFEDIPVWVHEFTEMYLWNHRIPLEDLKSWFKTKKLKPSRATLSRTGELHSFHLHIKALGYSSKVTHIIASLVGGSTYNGQDMTSDEAADFIFKGELPT